MSVAAKSQNRPRWCDIEDGDIDFAACTPSGADSVAAFESSDYAECRFSSESPRSLSGESSSSTGSPAGSLPFGSAQQGVDVARFGGDQMYPNSWGQSLPAAPAGYVLVCVPVSAPTISVVEHEQAMMGGYVSQFGAFQQTVAPSRNHVSANSVQHSEGATTFMLHNLPAAFTRTMLLGRLSELGLAEDMDFIHMPKDRVMQQSASYCFINFVNRAAALRWGEVLSALELSAKNGKLQQVWLSEAHVQGLANNLEFYKNTSARPLVKADGKWIRHDRPKKAATRPAASW